VLCWFNEKENSSITLNSKEMLFGAVTDNDNEIIIIIIIIIIIVIIMMKINVCLLYAKFYFHFQKINQRACNWDVFVRKLNFMLKIEGFA